MPQAMLAAHFHSQDRDYRRSFTSPKNMLYQRYSDPEPVENTLNWLGKQRSCDDLTGPVLSRRPTAESLENVRFAE